MSKKMKLFIAIVIILIVALLAILCAKIQNKENSMAKEEAILNSVEEESIEEPEEIKIFARTSKTDCIYDR